jgi:peptidoglycan L-alanyl-D-glutamate endopeptidase CwlK
LQKLFEEVVKHFDCTVIQGHRGEKEQNQAYDAGRSKLRYPDGKHNASPSRAVDVAPYPVDWEDRDRFHYFSGFVMGMATRLEKKVPTLKLRWGGDWDQDTEVKDNRFDDLVHFELVGEE